MLISGAYEKAKLYIESHSKEKETLERKKIRIEPGPFITISRETGAAAGEISDLVIDLIKNKSKTKNLSWAVFDKNLIEKVIEDHQLPEKLSQYLTEEKRSFLNSIMNELFGIHPSPLRLVHKTTKTILQLAHIGNCIVVGRAANIITRNFENSFHVRIIAPLTKRIEQVRRQFNLSINEAREFIEKEDKKRFDYVKHYFHKNIDDPSLYDLIINTEFLSVDQTAQIIAAAVQVKLKKFFKD